MSPLLFFKETQVIGFRAAWAHFMRRRHLPVYGYILLALATAFAIGQTTRQATHARSDLRAASAQVVYDGCQRDNQTRSTLRGLIVQGIPQTRQYVKEGTLTKAQGERAIAATKAAAAQLPDIDCQAQVEAFRARSSKREP